MASKATFSATCLLALLVANTFLAGQVAACNSCSHPSPPPPAAPKACPPPPYGYGKCPKDTLKLGVCANVLGLVKVEVGHVPTDSCCSLLDGLADLEVAVCLCTALKANILGINLDIPVNLSLLLNYCGKSAPEGFQCS